MQVVVAQRDRAQNVRMGAQVGVFVGQVREVFIGPVVAQRLQCRRSTPVIALRGSQARLQELRSTRVPADHPRDLVAGDARVDRQAIVDTSDGFLHPVVGPAYEIDLAKLRKHFQHEIVGVFLFDPRNQRQQQISGSGLVGGERHPTSTV